MILVHITDETFTVIRSPRIARSVNVRSKFKFRRTGESIPPAFVRARSHSVSSRLSAAKQSTKGRTHDRKSARVIFGITVPAEDTKTVAEYVEPRAVAPYRPRHIWARKMIARRRLRSIRIRWRNKPNGIRKDDNNTGPVRCRRFSSDARRRVQKHVLHLATVYGLRASLPRQLMDVLRPALLVRR